MAINAPSTLSVVAHKYKARAGYRSLFQLSFIYSAESLLRRPGAAEVYISSNLTERLRPWPSWVFLPPMCEQTCSPLLPIPVGWHHCPVSSHQRPQQGRPSSCDVSLSLPPTLWGWILISSPTLTLTKRPDAFLKVCSRSSWSSWSSSTLFLKKRLIVSRGSIETKILTHNKQQWLENCLFKGWNLQQDRAPMWSGWAGLPPADARLGKGGRQPNQI